MSIERSWKPTDPAEAFFPVELRPLYMPATGRIDSFQQLKRHFAVVDVEREHPFAVVTDDYHLITNRAAYDMAGDVMRKVFNTVKASDMACLNVKMPGTRSFCHIDLIHKSADFAPWEMDRWSAFLRITNSYNRTRLLRFELGFCRWICLNGMIFGSKSIEFSYAHMRRAESRIERFVQNIGDIRKLETALTEKLHQLKRYHVPEKEMLPLLCRVFGIQASTDVLQKPRRIEALITLRDQARNLTKKYFSQMGQHGYAALNVLTDFASRPSGFVSPEASMHGLQQRAGGWVDEFVAAIQSRDFSFDRYLEESRSIAELIESL